LRCVEDLPADGEEAVEDEEEYGLRDSSFCVDVIGVEGYVVVGNCEGSHGQRHAGRTEEHEGTASDLFNDEDGDE
jgi:hypothetical protein